MKPLPKTQQTRLLQILAYIDALWVPFRWSPTSATSISAIVERRIVFRRTGIAWVVGGSDADRQSGNRELRGLVSRGLVRLVGRGKGRGVALTEMGDNVARSLAPTKRVDEAWAALERVAATENAFGGNGNAGFVHEADVLGIDLSKPVNGNARAFDTFEDEALPLLASGLLVAWSDACGAIGYRLSDAGKLALAAGKPPEPADVPPYDSSYSDGFIEQYTANLHARESWQPVNRNHVVIPLSPGRWPRKPEASTDG